MLARGSVVRAQEPDSQPTPFGVNIKVVLTISPGNICPLVFAHKIEECSAEECSGWKFFVFDIFEINSATSDISGGLEFSWLLMSFQ